MEHRREEPERFVVLAVLILLVVGLAIFLAARLTVAPRAGETVEVTASPQVYTINDALFYPWNAYEAQDIAQLSSWAQGEDPEWYQRYLQNVPALLGLSGMEESIELGRTGAYEGYLPRQDFTETPEGWKVGGNPEEVYVGDATSELGGWYCFEGPIVEAANAYLQDQGSDWTAQAVSGLSQRQLNQYLKNDVPLAAWVTLDYTAPVASLRYWYLNENTLYSPYANLHCVVVVDYGEEGYLTADPLEGWQWVEESTFWDIFDAMGRRAVTINE